MKFILNEKYRLEERYILNEDDLAKPETTAEQGNTNNQAQAPSTAPSTPNSTTTTSKESEPALPEKKTFLKVVDNIKTGTDNAKDTIKALQNKTLEARLAQSDIKSIRQKISAIGPNPKYTELQAALIPYVQLFNNTYKFSDKISNPSTAIYGKTGESNDLRGTIDDIAKFILQKGTNTKDTAPLELAGKKALKKLHDADKKDVSDSTSIDALLLKHEDNLRVTAIAKLTDSLTAVSTAADNLAKAINQNEYSQIPNIPDAGEDLSDLYQQCNKLQTDGKAYLDSIAGAKLSSVPAFNSSKTKLSTTCPDMQQLLQDIANKINALVKQVKDKATLDDRQGKFDTAAGKSGYQTWTQIYKNLPLGDEAETEKFWNDYYKSYWGKNADNVKKLGYAFTQELTKIGFTANDNPFVVFVQKLFKLFENKNNKTPDDEKYNMIHNAYVNRLINNADLVGEVVDNKHIGPTNLIFCKNFYEQSNQDMRSLLTLQHTLLTSNVVDKLTPDTIKERYKGNTQQYMADLFYSPGKTTDLRSTGQNTAAIEAKNNPLKSLKEILRERMATGGSNNEATAKAKKQDFSIDSLGVSVKEPGAYNKVLLYIISTYAEDNYEKLAQQYSIPQTTTLSQKDISQLKKKFNFLNITNDNIESVLDQIKEKHEKDAGKAAEKASTVKPTV